MDDYVEKSKQDIFEAVYTTINKSQNRNLGSNQLLGNKELLCSRLQCISKNDSARSKIMFLTSF